MKASVSLAYTEVGGKNTARCGRGEPGACKWIEGNGRIRDGGGDQTGGVVCRDERLDIMGTIRTGAASF
jgi:hypothetical protein